MALQDLLFKKVLNLFFEVFPSFFHVYVVDITYTKIQSQLWLYNNYYYYNYHYFFTSLYWVWSATIMEWSLFLPQHIDWSIFSRHHRNLVIGVMSINSIFPAVCTRGKLRTFVSAVFYFKIAVIFNNLINYAFEHI